MSENEEKGQEFTPPASQEELDRIIAKRLERERNKFADYDDLKAKAEKLDALEESNKSELEKAVARAEAAEKRVSDFESQQQISEWKAQVSKETGVAAEALKGSSLEELQEHAEILKPFISDPKRGPYVPNAGATPPIGAGQAEEIEFARGLLTQLNN